MAKFIALSVLPLRAPIPRHIEVAGPDADPCLLRSHAPPQTPPSAPIARRGSLSFVHHMRQS
jgi:hypothetical protein